MQNFRKIFSKNNLETLLYPVLFGVLIGILWQTQILHKILGADTFTLPMPSRIFGIIKENPQTIWENVVATLIVALGGLLAGSLIGFMLGVLATFAPKWGAGGLTVIAAFNAIPIIAIAPIANNLTKGLSDNPEIRSMIAKMIVVTLTCMVPMSINVHRGMTELKPFSLDLMKSYAAENRTVFFKLRLPNSVPYIFTALRVSVPVSVISALVSEYFAEYIIGVGRQIRENIVLAQYATAWAYISVACLIGIILYAILLATEGIILKGQR